MSRYRIEVTGEWAGAPDRGWVPAVAGSLNQTSLSDEAVSTFDTLEAAEEFLIEYVQPENPDGYRIVEV